MKSATMTIVGIKVKELLRPDGAHYSWCFVCPACRAVHQCDDRWTFNGNHEAPTFGPLVDADGKPITSCSIMVNGDLSCPGRPRCHSHVTDGRIQYCGDCTHDKSGQTLEIQDWDFARGLGGAGG
jgi:hypothetical protein